jgi:hypothetical protein
MHRWKKEQNCMPAKSTVERAKKDMREGKAPTTAAGEFVREEIEHVRRGKHGARSPKQAIAIGLSKARRAGVPLAPPAKGKTSERTRKQAARDLRKAQAGNATKKPSAKRSRAVKQALKREGRSAASPQALAKQTRSAARMRQAGSRHQAAMKAVRTKHRGKKTTHGAQQAHRKAA